VPRVNSSLSSDELLLEDLETEGERQLKSLLHHQLDTSVSIEQCKSKRRCFAPAAFYKPFGEEAAGALSLSQFQALQESDKETSSLRELGLSDSEILLWKNQDSARKVGVLLSGLSRREMEIEQALFQGTDRHSFLRALYHQALPGSSSSPVKMCSVCLGLAESCCHFIQTLLSGSWRLLHFINKQSEPNKLFYK
uniref:RNA binding motif protein 41 n=1 Tax=Zonotrichia albicollis TaxID=44394 RepID=A0A8D2M331_ZONAL